MFKEVKVLKKKTRLLEVKCLNCTGPRTLVQFIH